MTEKADWHIAVHWGPYGEKPDATAFDTKEKAETFLKTCNRPIGVVPFNEVMEKSMSNKGWIGVDLDGTLAFYDHWRGPDHIGRPIPEMLERVKTWVAEGQDVRLFTARASVPEFPTVDEAARAHQERSAFMVAWAHWCREHGIPVLPVTYQKDYQMVALYDDRAVQVVPNTGTLVLDALTETTTDRDTIRRKLFEARNEIDAITRRVYGLLAAVAEALRPSALTKLLANEETETALLRQKHGLETIGTVQ